MSRDERPRKHVRHGNGRPRGRELLAEDLASALRSLEEDFATKERLSKDQTWCTPIPHERKVSTVRDFYQAFHDAGTLAIRTCMLCYRKRTGKELREIVWEEWLSSSFPKGGRSPFSCRGCFSEGESVSLCAECARCLARGSLSPAIHVHSRLGCEHMFPDELKGLTPVEEKLISLNSCYGFVAGYTIPGGQRQTVRYPRHVKGHITVFPNNVQELATKVLPHPLLQAMDEIHVSWQGAEKPAPSDLSSLLSVRRRVVERALVWLKRNNPFYAEIEIDTAEMESWGDPTHGVPPSVYERMERNEPSAWEKTRTAHVVPPTERAMDDEGSVEIEEIFAILNQRQETGDQAAEYGPGEGGVDRDGSVACPEQNVQAINEVTSSGMFALDGPPDVADVEKLRFACDAVGDGGLGGRAGPRTRVGSLADGVRGPGDLCEPYIRVSRGDEFADSFDTFFFAKTFPTLFPFGVGGPRLAEETILEAGTATHGLRGRAVEAEAAAEDLVSSRSLNLRRWADIVLRRHGGRFGLHHIFAFLVFNMGVRSRNRRVSMLSVTRKNFRKVERIVRSMTTERLAAARVELERSGKTTDDGVKELLRSLSVYGHRQPMSREVRLNMRRKIQSLIVGCGVPAIWFTINPNDITNLVKLRLAAHRTRDPDAAEEFLEGLENAYRRTRPAISDPMSSAEFFHREMKLFFDHYVKVGHDSVFGRISKYYDAIETNERGALHVHGLLWLHGNAHLSSLLADIDGDDQAAYRERVTRYVDSVFSEDLDQEGSCAVRAERSVTSDISSLVDNPEQFSATFDEEANFCAGATQVHTHSPTCVKYSLGKQRGKADLCRFKAPWRLVEKTAFTADGVLQIRRTHPMVNRWNKAIAVGLRHNHDISFIATQRNTMALIYYVTNYATKVEDPVWKRVAAAAELLAVSKDDGTPDGDRGGGGGEGDTDVVKENRTRQFLMRVANRVFTERPLSQVEVIADLLGYPAEFTNSSAWAYLNTSLLYWHVFRRWGHLRRASGAAATDDALDDSVVVEEAGLRVSHVEAYQHRGDLLRRLCLYDYISLVRLKRISNEERCAAWGEVPFEDGWAPGRHWVQVLRRPGKQATVCLDGYLSKDFANDDEESCHRRAAVQHLALFVPWESFLCEEAGDINNIWARARGALAPRISCLVDNVQLLRRSAEDAKRDAKQWAASCGGGDPTVAYVEEGGADGAGADSAARYQSNSIGDATRLIDIVRGAVSTNQVTAKSPELMAMMQDLCRFQQSALSSPAELEATVVPEWEETRTSMTGRQFSGAALPSQDQVRAIKSQQTSASKERENAIQGIQSTPAVWESDRRATLRSVMTGFGEVGVEVTTADSVESAGGTGVGMHVQLGPSTSFLAAGKGLARRLTLNKRQSIAFLVVCRQLDLMRRGESRDVGQLCQFVGGEGGTGKSRIIEALVELFAQKGLANRLLITATSGTAAARINGITIHSACGFSKEPTAGANSAKDLDGVRLPIRAQRFVHGQSRMDWQEKDMLVIDEVSMLGARTLHAVNEQLCRLRGSQKDFGGIPIVLFCGDFHQFRPVQERSIVIPSAAVTWDVDNSFGAEQRHQHEKAHALWKRFTTVVMLDEQMRAAGDPELQGLLKRIRQGVQDQADLDLLNSRCYREGRRIPWESGITVVTPLNRNRWNLNMEAALAFKMQQRSMIRIFISEHKWKEGLPTEEEAIMILNQGDDSAIPVPAIFMFVPGMPVVVNHNTHQGLKMTNGSGYMAVEVIVDKAYPGHRISADTTIHFGPPAGIILASETTQTLRFVGMPPGTILLTPMSVKIHCQRKRPWQQNDVSRKGLPCAAAFACTDYKVQGRTLERVALELRGTRTTNVDGRAVPAHCDPYSLYVQLSRCRTLDGIMLVSKVRERDLVGNRVPEEMTAAQAKLEELGQRTVEEALRWLDEDLEE
ncbi:membrane protein [Purpureocillium lavendulum]|uniref:ATP-dependent DNA helicase n=1 Tax=Purpureocillium lavendulum TaxID=1247861 RepID=A0AB34FFB9_9HYPO|nr:membrane protein [Purpureocillium lavendulum]